MDIVVRRPPSEGVALLEVVGSIGPDQERAGQVPAFYAEAVAKAGRLILRGGLAAPQGDPQLIADLTAAIGHARLGRILSWWTDGEVGLSP